MSAFAKRARFWPVWIAVAFVTVILVFQPVASTSTDSPKPSALDDLRRRNLLSVDHRIDRVSVSSRDELRKLGLEDFNKSPVIYAIDYEEASKVIGKENDWKKWPESKLPLLLAHCEKKCNGNDGNCVVSKDSDIIVIGSTEGAFDGFIWDIVSVESIDFQNGDLSIRTFAYPWWQKSELAVPEQILVAHISRKNIPAGIKSVKWETLPFKNYRYHLAEQKRLERNRTVNVPTALTRTVTNTGATLP